MLALLLACVSARPDTADTGPDGVDETGDTDDGGADTGGRDTGGADTGSGDTGDTRDTEDTGSACGDIPADDAGYADLFDAARVHEVALTFAAEARAALEADPSEWVAADLVVDGHAFPGVGAKWRGPSAEQRWDGKPGFRIGLRAMDACETFAGVETLILDAMTEDAARGRLVVAGAATEGLGRVAPRATYAALTVDGVAMGLYAHVETVDGAFVARRWPAGGTLWEGEEGADFTGRGLDAWDDVGGGGDEAVLEAVTQMAQGSADFYADADALVDMEGFLATWATLAALGHAGSYPYVADDVYVYVHPDDGRLRFVPWGVDAGWDPAFAVDGVEGILGLRCVYDGACSAALSASLTTTLDAVEALDVPALAVAAFAVSDAALDAEPAGDAAAVRAARTALLQAMATWPDVVRAQIE